MTLNAIRKKLKRQPKNDFKGWRFQAWLIVQAVSWCLPYPLSCLDLEEMFGAFRVKQNMSKIGSFQSVNTVRQTIFRGPLPD